MDLNRLSRGEQILGASAALFLILSFIPLWAKYESPEVEGFIESTSTRASAWSGTAFGFMMKIALIFAILALGLVIAKAAGGLDNVNLPVPIGLVYLGLAGIAFLLVLLNVIIGPQEEFGGLGASVDISDAGYEVSRGPLLFVGALVSAAMAAGAFLHFSGGDKTATTAGHTGGPPPSVPPGT